MDVPPHSNELKEKKKKKRKKTNGNMERNLQFMRRIRIFDTNYWFYDEKETQLNKKQKKKMIWNENKRMNERIATNNN